MSNTPIDPTSGETQKASLEVLKSLDAVIAAYEKEQQRPAHEKSKLFPYIEHIRKLRVEFKASMPEIIGLLEKAGLTDVTEQQLAAFCRSAKIKPRTSKAGKRAKKSTKG